MLELQLRECADVASLIAWFDDGKGVTVGHDDFCLLSEAGVIRPRLLQPVEVVFVCPEDPKGIGLRDSDASIHHELREHRTIDKHNCRL